MKPSILIILLQLAVFSVMLWYNGEHPFLIYDVTAASIMLTAATVILTGTAVIVAVVSLYGYRDIQKKSVEAAISTAEKIAEKAAGEAGEVATKIATSIASRVAYDATRSEEEESADKIAEASTGGE